MNVKTTINHSKHVTHTTNNISRDIFTKNDDVGMFPRDFFHIIYHLYYHI